MNTSRTTEDSTKVNSEDLTKIRGIGLTKQQWLRNLVGIYTIQELADASVDKIDSRLRYKGHNISRSEIEEWIDQANKLTNQSLDSQVGEAEELPPVSTVEGDLSPSVQEGEWKTFASFTVDFQSRQIEAQTEQQTIVRHIETGEVVTCPAVESGTLQQWMLEQLRIETQPEAEAQEEAVESPLTLEITQLRLFQPPKTERPMLLDAKTRQFLGSIRKDEPFTLEVTFGVTGLAVADIAKQHATYNIQCYARHRTTGTITTLADTQPNTIVKGQFSYTTLLPANRLPLGLYRLRVLVMLQGILAIPAYFEVPMLPVV